MAKISLELSEADNQIRPGILIAASFLGTLVIGLLDWLTGSDLSFFIFYLIPIFLAAWFGGLLPGIINVVLTMAIWSLVNIAWPMPIQFDPTLLTFFDVTEKVMFSCIFLLIVQNIRQLLIRQQKSARTDPITGLGTRTAWVMRIRKLLNDEAKPFIAVLINIGQYDEYFLNNGYQSAERLVRHIAAQTKARYPDSYRYAVDQISLIISTSKIDDAVDDLKAVRQAVEDSLFQNHGVRVSLEACLMACKPGLHTPNDITLNLHECIRTVRIKAGHEIGRVENEQG